MTDIVCNSSLAPYASDPSRSRGRIIEEPQCSIRNDFQRDRDRIIHSGAFRRLKYKTQVFVYHEGDNYRTRLTHSLEVAQIARTVARSLNLHEDLAETVALSHDLGHPPFGHTGEDALDACMQDFGGFDHNDQCLRVITDLERRYANFDGLNLTWESLEGIAKHNGPIAKEHVPPTIKTLNEEVDLQLQSFTSAEAQIAAIADDIAYNNHDVDDGLRAGFFTLDDLKELPTLGDIVRDVERNFPDVEQQKKSYEITRRMISIMVSDILKETKRRIKAINPSSPDDIRNAEMATVSFSSDMEQIITPLREFLMDKMYRHYRVNRMRHKVSKVVTELFTAYFEEPDRLPDEWQNEIGNKTEDTDLARVVLDYIAGMTDRYAIMEHRKLFDPYREQFT